MGRLEIVNTHSRRLRTPQDLSFGCRYSQRTLNQLGEDALSFQLVSRHLLECPACRAHRRRISKVDTALLKTLKQETPPFFEGRWETIRSNLNIPPESEEKREVRPFRQFNSRLIAAVIGLATLVGAAWSIDHRHPSEETALAVAPTLAVTAAFFEGEEVTVAVETEDDEDGTLYVWLGPEINDPAPREDRQ